MVLIGNLQGGTIKPFTGTDLTGDKHIGQKVHLHLYVPVSFAGFAPATLYIKGIPPLLISPGLGFGQHGKEIPDVVKHLGIGGGIAPRGAADRFLINIDDFIDMG